MVHKKVVISAVSATRAVSNPARASAARNPALVEVGVVLVSELVLVPPDRVEVGDRLDVPVTEDVVVVPEDPEDPEEPEEPPELLPVMLNWGDWASRVSRC